LAEGFANAFASARGITYNVRTNQRIYELSTVNPDIPVKNIRPLRESDMSFLPYWVEGFENQCRQHKVINGIYEFYIHLNTMSAYNFSLISSL
jgi:hypothetical protein